MLREPQKRSLVLWEPQAIIAVTGRLHRLAKETRETASSNHRRAQGIAKELRRPERLIQGAGRL